MATAAPSAVLASTSESPLDAPPLSIAGVGLPVIADGRIRNYVFVSLRLHLGRGQTIERMRAKEPYLRDALTRAAYRTPFTVADDWDVIDVSALSASLLRSAATLAGRGAVARVEVVNQTPRNRTRVQPR